MKYEVIADYPNSIFYIGQIIKLDAARVYTYYDWDGKYHMNKSEFDEYPHIFKILEDEPKS